MKDRIADPRGLGFAAIAIVAWMYSMLPAGWYGGASAAAALADVATFGWPALLIAALAAFLRRDSWHATFFMFWAAMTWSLRFALLQHSGSAEAASYGAWDSMAVAVASFFFFLAAMRAGLGIATVLLSAGLALVFFFDALGGWFGRSPWMIIEGYVGLLSALAAFWAMAQGLGGIGAEAGGAEAGGAASATL